MQHVHEAGPQCGPENTAIGPGLASGPDLAPGADHQPGLATWLRRAGALTPLMLAACGGGSSTEALSGLQVASGLEGTGGAQPPKTEGLSRVDAARLLTQATFGIRSPEEVAALQAEGIEYWLWRQFNMPCVLHTSYVEVESRRNDMGRASDELSYEAIWRQWLFEEGQLRARVAFALSQIMVISNVAPDIKPYAMSSYMDTLNRHAFGNFRKLLRDVTLHPAMGYYLNMLQSQKENTSDGVRPNENYAREVLQLFSIGLVKLSLGGAVQTDAQGKPIPTYGEAEVKGFARAFTGWSFGGQGNADPRLFFDAEFERDVNWVLPMKPFADQHESGSKQLLDGRVLPAGQTPEKDLDDALDNIFNHPNVGPFISRQLIQRLVTSNPSSDYIARVAGVFNDDGSGVRGNLRAVVRAILVDVEARGEDTLTRPRYGKQREPVIRLANVFRAFGATSPSPTGRTDLHYLDSAEDGLGQSPLLAPSVFNFFSPNYRHAGPLAQAGLVAPEFQITTETTAVGCFNTFARVFNWEGYGWGEVSRLSLDFKPWLALARQPEQLVERMNQVLCLGLMGDITRARLITLIRALPDTDWQIKDRVKQAFIVLAVSPDFVIQK